MHDPRDDQRMIGDCREAVRLFGDRRDIPPWVMVTASLDARHTGQEGIGQTERSYYANRPDATYWHRDGAA